ncbi:vWA domain-containing protein [Desulfosporosinus meridiei]|uniref:Protein containing von Willebrand factor type A (VWA) domain n=1 Tax=Desulfosporosinus meridiei (strain ATCC BAA-275 / DSM 13257 / KCTC 12902 / NCIMB 13706 / S10) TaxID=768704 RepID=J7IV39_DESMD|nr:protein containing von Willebrand factor type A (vWA) domain [Desulfosporosinus meridiei DSM 13257]
MHMDINSDRKVSELDKHLVEFAQLLRTVGIKISPSEIFDAAEGLSLIGLVDRDRVESVLQATMVKDVKHISAFRETFRAYFATLEQKEAWNKAAAQKADQWNEQIESTYQDLRFQDNELDITEEQRAVYASMSEDDKQRLRDFLEKSSNGTRGGMPLDHSYQPMVERVLRGSLEYWRRKLNEDEPILSPGSTNGILSEVERALRDREVEVISRDLKKISPEEWPEVVRLIRRLSQRLADQVTRRYRAARRRGGLDMRLTLRKNLRYGGVLIDRSYRSRRKGRLKIVLLCDISGSMLKYSEFIWQFVYGLSTVVNGIKTFAFGEMLVPLNQKFKKGQTFETMVKEALSMSGKEWGGGTNLANALEALHRHNSDVFSKQTLLLIVSDAQTLEGEKAAQLLSRANRQVRKVLWLNTLPERRWSETPFVKAFLPFCQMYECYTLGHLTQILNKQF